ncbi:MAG: DUF4924 family protein [Rikenellaceae bacterium]
MDISRHLRSRNISEYILYLWQLEDLLRSLQFSPQAIYSQFIAPREELSPVRQQEIFMWYREMCELLESEGKRQSGHLEHTLHLIADLQDLHLRLLHLPIGARYRTLWVTLEEVLPDLRAVLSEEETPAEISDIELCFRALYGAVLYKLKGENGRGAVEDTIAYISPVIAELSSTYGKVERGECDLYWGVPNS